MIRVVYIGARPRVARAIIDTQSAQLQHVFALKGSPLIAMLPQIPCATSVFTSQDKERIVAALATLDYDLLLSAGLPIILPISQIRRPGQRFWNLHPSLLPALRGLHPANGALLFGHERTGVTLHEMIDRVDSGGILRQREFPITPDLDLGLLYYLLFELEAEIVSEALTDLAEREPVPRYPETPNSYYRRSGEDMAVDLSSMSRIEVLRRIRAFGVGSQGIAMSVGDRRYQVFAAEPVDNPAVAKRFATVSPGSIALEYDGKLLVQSSDGLIKITQFAMA